MLRCEQGLCLPVADQSLNQGPELDPSPSPDLDPDLEGLSEVEQIHALDLRCRPVGDTWVAERIQKPANASEFLV